MKEAAKYIDQLQNNLICRIRTHGYPEKLKSNNRSQQQQQQQHQDSESIKNAVQAYLVQNSKWS